MVASKAIEQGRAPQDESNHCEEHADSRWETCACRQIERQVKQEHRNHTKVHVIVPLVVSNVEQVRLARLLLQLITSALIIGIIHLLKPVGRFLFQIELPLRHGFGELGILLRILTADLKRVRNAMAVPRSEVVGRRGNAHKIGPHEEKRRDEHDLNRDRADDSSLRELWPASNAHAVNARTRSEEIRKRQDADHAEKAKEVE